MLAEAMHNAKCSSSDSSPIFASYLYAGGKTIIPLNYFHRSKGAIVRIPEYGGDLFTPNVIPNLVEVLKNRRV